MAINYTNLFENIGEYVDRVNEFATTISTLGTGLSEIHAELTGNSVLNVLDGEVGRFDRMRTDVLGWIDQTRNKILELMLDKTTVRDELNLGDVSDFGKVFEAFYKVMLAATEYVTPNVVTLSAVTPVMTNTEVGTAIVSKVLDGVTPPHPGYPVVSSYSGEDSELALTDDMALVCVADSEVDGLAEGNEQFQWVGNPSAGHNYSWLVYGSGTGPLVSPIQSGTLMNNLEFQNFTSNAPDDWDVDTGTAGTHIDDDTVTFYRGTTALKLVGDASLAAIQISQDAPDTLVPKKRYAVGFWIIGNASSTSGTLTIQFEGTGYTASSSERILLNNAAIVTGSSDWSWYSFFINMPAEIPDDFELVIKFDGTPSAHEIFINGGGMKEVDYFNGHCVMIYAGQNKYLRGDRMTYTVTNNYAGVFQTAFAKLLGVQVPSDASPTQADSLAT